MVSVIIDASVILAIAKNEKLNDEAYAYAHDAIISSVNACEVLTKFIDKVGMTMEEATNALNGFKLTIEPFDQNHFYHSAMMYSHTKKLGLSLGDRACLALALHHKLPVITTDRKWEEAGEILGLTIIMGR